MALRWGRPSSSDSGYELLNKDVCQHRVPRPCQVAVEAMVEIVDDPIRRRAEGVKRRHPRKSPLRSMSGKVPVTEADVQARVPPLTSCVET
jgi:hypothetical protein